MNLRIVNIVATANLGQPVDLKEVARIRHTIHDPDIYGGRVGWEIIQVRGGEASRYG